MYTHITSQDALGTSATTSVTKVYPGATTSGNLLIASVFAGGVGLGATTITNWTQAATVSFLSAADQTTLLYKVSAGTEASITANTSGASSMVLAIHEFGTSPLPSAQTWLDQTNTNSTAIAGTTLTTGSITPTKTNELIIALMAFPTGGTSAWSWDNGVTVMNSNVNLVDGFLVDADITARNPAASWTGASTAGGCIASFFNNGLVSVINDYQFVRAGGAGILSVSEKVR